MKVYTKGGDDGTTGLLNGSRVPKTNERIELNGTIDELNSAIGLAKVLVCSDMKDTLEKIQRNLMTIMSGAADPTNRQFRFDEHETEKLEYKIDAMEDKFPRQKDFVLYGGCELSARFDMARSIARRAERRFYALHQKYGADRKALTYLNRLSDFLYIAARYSDFLAENKPNEALRQEVIGEVLKNYNVGRF